MYITEPLLKAFLLCETVIVDDEKRFSIINNFNTLTINHLPVKYSFKLYLSLMVPQGQHELKIGTTRPDNKEKWIAIKEFSTEEPGKFDAIISVDPLDIEMEGAYLFTVFLDNKPIGKDELTVILLETIQNNIEE